MTAKDEHLLREAFRRQSEMPFPAGSALCDILDELHADLVEYDGHVAGIASSLLGSAPVRREWLTLDHALRASVELQTQHDDPRCRSLAQEYLDYLVCLEKVLELSRRVATQSNLLSYQ